MITKVKPHYEFRGGRKLNVCSNRRAEYLVSATEVDLAL